MRTTLIIIAAAVQLLAWTVVASHRLLRLCKRADLAGADVGVPLMRGQDLMPSLVTAAYLHAGTEPWVLATVSELQAATIAARACGTLRSIESTLSQGIFRLLASMEIPHDIKARENPARLQRHLLLVEQLLQYARRFYTGAMCDFTDALQPLPHLCLAGAGHGRGQ